MFSYKMKNYVLIDAAGEITVRGSGLKSRGLERFQRRFMEDIFRLLMRRPAGGYRGVVRRLANAFRGPPVRIAELMKTDTLQDSLEIYRQKISGKAQNLAAAYELALQANGPYHSGDQISYYVAAGANASKCMRPQRWRRNTTPPIPTKTWIITRQSSPTCMINFARLSSEQACSSREAEEESGQQELFAAPAKPTGQESAE